MPAPLSAYPIPLPLDAVAVVEETGLTARKIARDVEDVRAGHLTRAGLLALCLDWAEDDRVPGWRSYVDAVCAAARSRRIWATVDDDDDDVARLIAETPAD